MGVSSDYKIESYDLILLNRITHKIIIENSNFVNEVISLLKPNKFLFMSNPEMSSGKLVIESQLKNVKIIDSLF